MGQGRHARVRLGLIGQQYRAIKLYEPRYQNEFEREQAIFETDLIEHPNILGKLIVINLQQYHFFNIHFSFFWC